MAQGHPLPGEQYLHFKNKLYQIVAVAYHSENMERYVVYQALYGDFKTYIRPYDMFISEVDHEKYPDVKQKYRFQYLGNVADVPVSETEDTKDSKDTKDTKDLKDTKDAEDAEESVKTAVEVCEEAEAQINPWLEKVLDAATFEEKYKIVCDMQREVTDRLIDDIAVVMDLAIPEGDLQDRYSQLKYCIRTKQRYESGRMR